MPKKMTAQDVYNQLVNVDKIKSKKGQIHFDFGNVNIVVKQRDVVGNLMQEWLQGWFIKNNVSFATNNNSQTPPDFFLNLSDKTTDLLEIKAFNRQASAAFDIANFRAYAQELLKEPWMLNADYLIFGYDMSQTTGDVTVKDVWLKKVWEITRPMEKWPLNLQVKKGVVHNIRPGAWYSNQKNNIPMFQSREHFLSAVEETIWQNADTRPMSSQWKNKFQAVWKKKYGKDILFDRWSNIKSLYV